MNLHHILYLAALLLPLSLDTFIMSAALGMAGLPKKDQIRTSLILASFEALMPVAGVVIGKSFGDLLGHFAGYTAAVVIGFAGWLMLKAQRRRKGTATPQAALPRQRVSDYRPWTQYQYR